VEKINNNKDLHRKGIYMRNYTKKEYKESPGRRLALLEKHVTKVENLRGRIANDLKKTKSTPIEIYKNRCLQAVERVGRIAGVSTKQKDNAKKRLFKVYIELQEYSGSERQVWDHDRETPIDEFFPGYDGSVVEAYSAKSHSGGLGFSTARGLLLADGVGIVRNPYYNELNAAKCGPPMDSSDYVPRHKPTTQEHIEEMARQKKEVLSNG